MWIIPKNLIISDSATDTVESNWDSLKSSVIASEPLLFVKSKPLPSKTLLQKWNKGCFTRVQYGMIYGHSLGESFTEKWTSSREVSLARASQPLESDSQTQTQGTCSHTSLMESKFADLPLFSLKMLRESFPQDFLEKDGTTQQGRLFCSMSVENWKEWVTRCRGEYSQRVNSVSHTNENESSSSLYPTVTVADGGKIGCQANYGQVGLSNHPSIVGYPTRPKLQKSRAPLQDQGSHSTSGSQKECANWATPNTMDALPSRSYEAMKRQATNGGRKNRQRPGNLREQIDPLMCQAYKDAQYEANNWSTPRAGATDNSQPNNKGGIPLGDQCRREEQWATPSAGSDNGGPTGLGGGSGNRKKMNLLGEEGRAMCCGKLNPRWVETLMNVPIGWTMPSCTPEQLNNPSIYTSCDNRTDELRLLGNGCVVATVSKAFTTLLNKNLQNTT
jgi:hypothetical protein